MVKPKVKRPSSSQRPPRNTSVADAEADFEDEEGEMEEGVKGEEEGEEAEGEGKSSSKLVNHQLSALPSFFIVPLL